MVFSVNDIVCLKADVENAARADAERAEAIAKGEKPLSVRHTPREYRVLAAFADTLRLKHGDQEVTVDDDKACPVPSLVAPVAEAAPEAAPEPAPAEPAAPTE